MGTRSMHFKEVMIGVMSLRCEKCLERHFVFEKFLIRFTVHHHRSVELSGSHVLKNNIAPTIPTNSLSECTL